MFTCDVCRKYVPGEPAYSTADTVLCARCVPPKPENRAVTITLSEADWDKLERAAESPPEPIEDLKQLFRDHPGDHPDGGSGE